MQISYIFINVKWFQLPLRGAYVTCAHITGWVLSIFSRSILKQQVEVSEKSNRKNEMRNHLNFRLFSKWFINLNSFYGELFWPETKRRVRGSLDQGSCVSHIISFPQNANRLQATIIKIFGDFQVFYPILSMFH